MKAAVSIPDDVFAEGERLARRLRTSRSGLYARALADFVARHGDDQMTAAMNRVLDEVGTEIEGFTRRAARRVARHAPW
jgi:predicted transcriptional regulator